MSDLVNYINIPKEEYDYLKISAMKYSELLQVLIDEAELNDSYYRDEEPLRFNNKKTNMVISLIEKQDYQRKIKELMKKEEKEDE